jgi:hypothetical protein
VLVLFLGSKAKKHRTAAGADAGAPGAAHASSPGYTCRERGSAKSEASTRWLLGFLYATGRIFHSAPTKFVQSACYFSTLHVMTID